MGGSSVWFPRRMISRVLSGFRIRSLRGGFLRNEMSLREEYFRAAAAQGKPRGLHWAECSWLSERVLLRERENGQWWVLSAVNLSFEAVAGGEMEGVEAVSMVREACAVFVWSDGSWRASGRTLFNMGTERALTHLEETHEFLGAI